MIYLHPEYVVQCVTCNKTVILDRRSPRDEMTNTWDMIERDLLAAGWTCTRREGYVFDETCPGPHQAADSAEPTRTRYVESLQDLGLSPDQVVDEVIQLLVDVGDIIEQTDYDGMIWEAHALLLMRARMQQENKP